MDYRSVIESKYSRANWQALLHDIFGQKVVFWQKPQPVPVSQTMAKSALYTGRITLQDANTIAIYEVELSDSVIIERNRAGIRNLLCSNWRSMGCTGAFMFCFRNSESVLRFSYVSESFAFSDDGSLRKDSTDTKRFTYLLGEGHRSRTAIQQFENLKHSILDLKSVTKAFSVEALSDLFFKEYKKQYEDIIEYVTGKRMVKVGNNWIEKANDTGANKILMQQFSRFSNPEKAVRDYVKKLMGRLVFIQFLQKKGWMGCPAGDAWTGGDSEFVQNLFKNTRYKDTFIDDVLEPLFDDINTRRQGDLATSPNVGIDIKIPYLNGGLFERDDYDETDFPLPEKFIQSLLDFFASYNFTIDENDPDDAEIGVDPEMLGRIFENLLEDNKDKGAFYTPKEIVQYMCRESLIAYLQTDIADEATKQSFRDFVTTHDVSMLHQGDVYKADCKLREVKICDPAIGSGAFPMGLLKELFACRMAIEGIEEGVTPADVKKDIIQNSIYGVDIEKGAVDIARLRFWLSLILDEDTPHALPNMDFKIMQGNSLLEQYEGVDLSKLSENKEEKRKKLRKDQGLMQSLVFDEGDALSNIQNSIKRYYSSDNHEVKIELRNIINENIRNYIITLKDCTPEIQQKLRNLPIPNDQFFLWHIYFKDVFDKGGFDIVIGNPPYFNVQSLGAGSDYIEKVKKAYADIWQDKSDILFYFYRLAMYLSSNVICYITSNAYLFSDKAKKLRNVILDYGKIKKIVNFEEFMVFNSASITTCITTFSNNNESFKAVNLKGNNYTMEFVMDYVNNKANEFPVDLKYNQVFALIDSSISKLNDKIDGDHPHLNTIFKIGKGMETAANEVFCFSEMPSYLPPNLIKRRMCGESIQKYIHTDKSEFILYLEDISNFEDLPVSVQTYLIDNKQTLKNRATVKNEGRPWWRFSRPMHKEYYCFNKIWCSYRNKTNEFALDETNDYIGLTNTTVIFDTNKELSLRYLISLLNSKLLTYRYKSIGKQTGSGVFEFFENGVGKLPIVVASKHQCNTLEKLVDEIMSIKKQNPQASTSTLEDKIDRLVYQLYGLTNAEVKIIDPAAITTGNDNDPFIP